jgi:steroid 5-alpha reductase family enzyme
MTLLLNMAIAYGLIMACMLILWRISIRIRDVSIVDLFWGGGFGLVALVLFLVNQPTSFYAQALTLMPVLWSLRYTIHIFRRNWGHGEDARYTKLRSWVKGDAAFHQLSLKKVFLVQGNWMFVVSLPIVVGLSFNSAPVFPFLVWLGAAVWLVGILLEAIADRQLTAFRADPEKRGTILDTGLWRYSRHPNYFGNATLWWGIFIAACAQPWALLTVISPYKMNYLLVNVTGVATLEKKMSREKPAYADYMARTNRFIPWPPKKMQLDEVN